MRLYGIDARGARRRVVDSRGQTLLDVHAWREADVLYVKLEGRKEGVKLKQIGSDCRVCRV